VIATFLKNGHCYTCDYNIQVESLGHEISAWWNDISGTAYIGFGGPTGIYMMVVLISWWCSLLRNQSASDRSTYNLLVEQFNSAILDAIVRANQSGEGASSTGDLLLASPPPPSQNNHYLAKRTRAEEPPLSRKKQKA
jgi:hypothetical protein